MAETRILIDHFFRRFFDNDTIQVEGDTTTTVARAVAFVAAPGLMCAFFLQIPYSKIPGRPLWASIQDQYFFVLFSFVVMGVVAIFEWDMLFPDRLDFLILTPLSIKPRQMLAAKAAALVKFFAIFLVSCNIFGAVILPAVSKGDFFRQLWAHAVATALAGVFAATFFLALGGLLLCVLNAAQFRVVSPAMQMLGVTALLLLMAHYLKYGDGLQDLLSGLQGSARWMPPLWFLGVYEQLLHGDAAPAFAHQMTRYALRGTAAGMAVAILTYPLAWARMRRMAVEGGSQRRRQPARWFSRLFHGLVQRPGERAVFHFIGQTMARNNRYQVYLAMYCGAGLGLALACAVSLQTVGGDVHAGLSEEGLHATMPLLLFWVIAGLRTAFAFPMNLSAGWIFRISGVSTVVCAAAGRRWVFYFAIGVLGCILAVSRAAGWDWRRLMVQAVCGLCVALVLTDGFFFSQQDVPFNRPRMPGKSSFPLLLTLYVGVFPVFVTEMMKMEMGLEKHLVKLVWVVAAAVVIHVGMGRLRNGTEEIEEEMEGYEGEFQLLGLS